MTCRLPPSRNLPDHRVGKEGEEDEYSSEEESPKPDFRGCTEVEESGLYAIATGEAFATREVVDVAYKVEDKIPRRDDPGYKRDGERDNLLSAGIGWFDP